MTAPRLIALTSPAPGSGKSVIANHLVARHGFELVKFAGPLKGMLRSMLGGVGFPCAVVDSMLEGDLKETVIPEIGVSPRQMMITLGTEWGRDCIRQDLWVHLSRLRINNLLCHGKSVVIDDMRFINELDMIEEIGGMTWRIVRPGKTYEGNHRSEGALDGMPVTATLKNGGTIADLETKADALLL